MPQYHDFWLPDSITGDLFRATDWSATGFGAIESWPTSLKTATQICLTCQFPMALAWRTGDHFSSIYNDSYLPIAGDKHPVAFGKPLHLAYEEIWTLFLEEYVARVVDGGEVIWEVDFLIPLLRETEPEELYFTFCYSPLVNEAGERSGFLCTATDRTSDVIGRRRETMIAGISRDLTSVTRVGDFPRALHKHIVSNSMDFKDYGVIRSDASTGEMKEEFYSTSADFSSRMRNLVIDYKENIQVFSNRSFAVNMRKQELGTSDHFSIIFETDSLVVNNAEFNGMLHRLRRDIILHAERIRERERALTERDRHYRLLFENSQDGIFISLSSGSILAANLAACGLLEYTEAELIEIGRQGVVFEDSEEIQTALAVRQQAGRYNGELIFRKKSGTTIVCDVSTVSFTDEDGNAENIIFFRDASARKLAESRNQQSARLEAIGQLTGGVAHDFNNLLQVILAGSDEIMQSLNEDDELYDSASMVLSASLKAGDLTRQLLAFSRQQVLEPKVVSLNALIHDVDQIIDRALGEQVNVRLNLSDDVNVFLDPSQLQSAIVNLAVNGRDAMPYGGTLSIESRIAQVDDMLAEELGCGAGEYVAVSISDTGAGIAADEIAHVIEPFYTTKPIGQGTGLGLSMVFGFVHQSGGGMKIASELGQGTRIELYLPLSDAAIEDMPDSPEVSPGIVQGAHVLIVEDNELLADMLSRILERAGHQVEVARNGQAAITRIDSDSEIDIVITDIILGTGIDGWLVANTCRDIRPDLPIVIMTGFEGSEIKGHRNALDVPILRKPFQKDDVLAVISRLLG